MYKDDKRRYGMARRRAIRAGDEAQTPCDICGQLCQRPFHRNGINRCFACDMRFIQNDCKDIEENN